MEMDERLAEQFFAHDYHDRGIQKWQGYFLSDHTQLLHQQHRTAAQQQSWAQLTPFEPAQVVQMLRSAYRHNQVVTITWQQSNGFEVHYQQIQGKITGWQAGWIRIGQQALLLDNVLTCDVKK
ncbi:hypothetical protein M3M35_01735 [Fructilactobacillus myrtifloralis]|uniref:DNA-directed RNA polymerase beta subunit n=1 Tax=Fructilactobacillus myrtifloralis TaxID=2940301 RepID=A0ABY5BP62_9LACO|nr:hypothetical protein [Fructilactobacillus myrtifloralis]USS85412.1 hypothetical protein M3M35_01735 [Fructilactobacillus myrtifloralis]